MGEMSYETTEERVPGSGMSLAGSGTTKELSWIEDEKCLLVLARTRSCVVRVISAMQGQLEPGYQV